MITASALPRIEACPSSDVLPAFDEGSSADASHGTAVHAYLDRICKGDTPQQALQHVDPEHHEACLALDLSLVPHSQTASWRSEVALALNTSTGEGIELQVTDRAYPSLPAGWVPGTADLVGLDPDGVTVTVLDVKTGRRHLGRPANHLQVLHNAVAAAAVYGRSRARVGFLYLHEGEETPRLVVDELDEFALAGALERVRDVVQAVEWVRETKAVEPRLGEHCRYCPAMRGCPARVALVRPFLSNDMDVAAKAVGGTMLTIRKEELPAALDRVRAVIDLGERVKKELEDAVRACGGVDLPDGRVLAEVRVEKESIDADQAEASLRSVFGDEGPTAIEVKRTLTKAAIERLARQRAAVTKQKISELTEAALSALRQAGAVRTTSYSTVKATKRRSTP